MAIWNRKPAPATQITPPEGCAAVFSLLCEKQLDQDKDVVGERAVASMACPGMAEAGRIELADQVLPHDSSGGPWPSKRSRKEGLVNVAAEAGQQAALICVGCPSSVLKEVQDARRAALLAQAVADRRQALEDLARQHHIAQAIEELTGLGLPDTRMILDVAALPVTEFPGPAAPGVTHD